MRGRDVAIVVGAVALVILLIALLGGGMMGPGMMGWGGFGPNPLWWVFMLLFWALIIGGGAVLLIWLFRQAQPSGAGLGPTRGRPLDILQERYARGEITREQYEEMRRDLERE